MEHNGGQCIICGHGMLEHGNVDGVGYCANGNNGDCLCKEKGLSYEEALEELT